MNKLLLFFLIAACVQAVAGGFYEGKSDVITLTKANFAQLVMNDDHVWMIEFYAPWCGHCQRLTPEWEKAASNLKGLVRIGAINCDEEKEFCGGFGIQGFPTIKLFPAEKNDKKKPTDYQQARTAAAIVKFALSYLPNYSTTLTAANSEKFLGASSLAKVLLFSNKPETTSLWKGLTVDFKGRLSFAEVKHTQKDLVEKFSVTSFPTLVVVKTDGEKVVYDGKLSHAELHQFLSNYAPPPAGSSAKPAAADLPAEVHEVKTQEDFEKHCTTKAGSCLIAFLDVEDEEGKRKDRDLKMLKELAEKFKKSFHFVWLDGAKNFDFADKLGTTILPSVSVYNHGKKAYVPLVGAFEIKALEEFLKKVLTNKKPALPVPLIGELPKIVA